MYCPNCQYGYLDAVMVCADCGAALVPELPPDQVPESVEFVTVMEITGDPALLAFAESVLDDAGIVFRCRRVSPVAALLSELQGPVEVQVERDRAEEATELLAEIKNIEPGDITKDSV